MVNWLKKAQEELKDYIDPGVLSETTDRSKGIPAFTYDDQEADGNFLRLLGVSHNTKDPQKIIDAAGFDLPPLSIFTHYTTDANWSFLFYEDKQGLKYVVGGARTPAEALHILEMVGMGGPDWNINNYLNSFGGSYYEQRESIK
jgi:hypothetical protein